MYENYPFWFTFFTELGFRVEFLIRSSKKFMKWELKQYLLNQFVIQVKLVHGHIMSLINKGCKIYILSMYSL